MYEALFIALYLIVGVVLIGAALRRQPTHKKLAAARNKWTPLTTALGVLLWPIFLLLAIRANARRG